MLERHIDLKCHQLTRHDVSIERNRKDCLISSWHIEKVTTFLHIPDLSLCVIKIKVQIINDFLILQA
jgi:hypothetical protein